MKKLVIVLTTFLLIVCPLWAADPCIGTGLGDFSTGINCDGKAYAWGYNNYGQLGNNSTTESHVPVAVDISGVLAGKTLTEIANGWYNTIALDSDGKVYAWGSGTSGQLGNNSLVDSHIPVAVDVSGVLAGKTLTGIANGWKHPIALDSDGKVYAWGYNTHGQLGNNSTTESSVPVAVDISGVLTGKTITAISGGSEHTIALDSDGKVYTWGYNNYGQLGNNSTTESHVPVAVDISGVLAGKIITDIAAGTGYSVVLDSDGKVYAWGVNWYGQLGNNSYTDSHVPVAVDISGILSGKTITAIVAGGYHTIAMDSDKKVYTWGANNHGQLGNNSTSTSTVPVAVDISGVMSGKTMTAIGAGWYHTTALGSDGKVYTWGYNDKGQLGDNSTTQSLVPVIVSGEGGVGELALPITFVSFTAEAKNGKVELAWETATETNNANFVIYRNNEAIASVAGAGTTTEPQAYSYVDAAVVPGVTYTYVLADVDYANEETKYEADAVTVTIANDLVEADFVVGAAYPNPFNPMTIVPIELSRNAIIKASLFNVNGREIKTLINTNFTAGTYDLRIDGTDLTTGMYLLQVVVDNVIDVQKIALIK